MDEPEFQIVEHRFDIPFRGRSGYADYITFRVDQLQVYLNPQVGSELRALAARARPRETGGLLAGRILRDDTGPYVVVTGMAEAPKESGDLGRFELSPEGTENLRERLAQHQPSADVIGWWHSHPAPSHYSQTDLRNQTIWMHPHHLGLLVFAEGKPWSVLYVGPDARGGVRPSPPTMPPTAQPAAHTAWERTAPPTRQMPPMPGAVGGRLGRTADLAYRRRGTMILALAALVAGSLTLLLLGLLARALSAGPEPVPPRLSWSCVALASGYATCQADSDDPVEWYLGRRHIGDGPEITFQLPTNGPGIVRVIVRGPNGSYGGGERVLVASDQESGDQQPQQQTQPSRQQPRQHG